jgi:hypothetical protein
MFGYASKWEAGQSPARRRSTAAVVGFMVWGALWAYGGGPAGFVVDMAHQMNTFIHTGLSVQVGHRDDGAVDLHVGLSGTP